MRQVILVLCLAGCPKSAPVTEAAPTPEPAPVVAETPAAPGSLEEPTAGLRVGSGTLVDGAAVFPFMLTGPEDTSVTWTTITVSGVNRATRQPACEVEVAVGVEGPAGGHHEAAVALPCVEVMEGNMMMVEATAELEHGATSFTADVFGFMSVK
jgi:hypothetical protein